MPNKTVILWRLCDWYLHERKFPVSTEQLFEIFRAVTKAKAVPWAPLSHNVGDMGMYMYEIPKEPKILQVAEMFRHLHGNIFKKKPDGWQLDWVWQGYMAKFPHLFTAEAIKADNMFIKKMAKQKLEV